MSAKIGDAGYRIIGPIASGGMGEVYKAEHVITRRIEAIKLLSGAGTAEQSERFLREIQLQASLSHPNIAAVYNAFRVGDDLVMVMELVEGEPLRALLSRTRLSLDAAVDYACQALRAIAYAHEHGVIHRDITPGNIIITSQGIVKLTDFGLAKTAAPSSLSQSGAAVGSPHYMSPEQVIDSTRASARSDLYSLGAVLYEMVAGRKPFEGESSFSVMQAQVEQPPVPPIAIQPSIPPALNQVILTALEKDPERRFASADDFRLALENAVSPTSAPAANVAQPPPPVRPTRRRFSVPLLQIAAVCAVLLPVAMIVDSARRHSSSKPAPPKVEIKQPEPQVPVPPVSQAPAPPVQTPDVAPAPVEKPVERAAAPPPAVRRRTRVGGSPKRDSTPTITSLERPEPATAAEPVRPSLAPVISKPAENRTAAPESSRGSTPGASPAPAPASLPAESAAGQSPDSPAAAASDSQVDTTREKEKKPRNRVWRALGKILGRSH